MTAITESYVQKIKELLAGWCLKRNGVLFLLPGWSLGLLKRIGVLIPLSGWCLGLYKRIGGLISQVGPYICKGGLMSSSL